MKSGQSKALKELIIQAHKTNSTHLDLGRRRITELPPEIGMLRNLKSLYLRNNRLSQLPAEIGLLENLELLMLQSNVLAQLPSAIGKLLRLRRLELYGNRLVTLPPEIGLLSSLEELLVSANHLRELPRDIGKLTSLDELDVRENDLSHLPKEIGELVSLRKLDVGGNQLTALPHSLVHLTNLTTLSADRNAISSLDPSFGSMRQLSSLSLRQNKLEVFPGQLCSLSGLSWLNLAQNHLAELPAEIGKLQRLHFLDVQRNRLTQLPPALSGIPTLESIYLDDNPLVSPPAPVIKQGKDAVLAYLRARAERTARQWISKLLLVGQGGVGKTSLLRALMNEPFDHQESTTHGIAIRSVLVDHPDLADTVMELKAWDFGGQEIYHATHQFFLTDRSLFVLVWNARHGYEQGRLHYWLDIIHALAPRSPVLIVSTHIDQRDADLPIAEIQQRYQQVVGHWPISNLTGQGTDALREAIAQASSRLPLMGEFWPGAWMDAANAVRARPENCITPSEFRQILAAHSAGHKDVLAKWLHELGDILYFKDDDELKDVVILKPEWVTRCISRVLESDRIAERLGIFTRDDMDELWADLDIGAREHFLRLMEHFDLSYRTLENREISIVVERLRHDPPPDYHSVWNSPGKVSSPEISMKLQFSSTIPAGLPTWFIARSHRFTTHTHWRYGAVFADTSARKHVALVISHPHDRYIELRVRGPQPQNFFALLREGLELTIRRFPGLRVDRKIPCPCAADRTCGYEFDLAYLELALEQRPPVAEVQCQKTFSMIPVSQLLFGIHWRLNDRVLEELAAMRGDISELLQLSQREFLSIYRRQQASVDSECPNVFTLRPAGHLQTLSGTKGGQLHPEWLVREMELQLFCQAPGHWHATENGGRYILREPAEWIMTIAPYLKKLASLLTYSVGVSSSVTMNMALEHHVDFMRTISQIAPETTATSSDDTVTGTLVAEGALMRAVHQMLTSVDPSRNWGGLRKVLTPEGHYLWLCDRHASAYNI